jgi:magnesium chelatase subunit I
VLLCFTANPEDYTARGKIITPLKDRIGSEIVTHYPETVELGMSITQQEAWSGRGAAAIRVPDIIAELIERVAFEARTDRRVDRKSGVSQRMPISATENVISNAERRAAMLGEPEVVARVSDVYAALPAITGKLELEYEGELVGAAVIACELVRRAADQTLRARAGDFNSDEIAIWFDEGSALQVTDDASTETTFGAMEAVPGLMHTVHNLGLAAKGDKAATLAACELVLEALVARKKISRSDAGTYARAVTERRKRGPESYGGEMTA